MQSRSSIGGDAILPPDISVPVCRNCDLQLLLFLQFDVDAAWELPIEAGSHLAIFMCPNCNEIPCFSYHGGGELPDRYWETTEGHFFAVLGKPTPESVVRTQPPLLMKRKVRFEPVENAAVTAEITAGGEPQWIQDPEEFVCCCGEKMAFIAQVAENFGFRKQPDAPSQPNSFSADEYCLFLGNEIYIFACPKQCHPRAVWITVQG